MAKHESVAVDTSPIKWEYPVCLNYVNSDTVALRNILLTVRYDASAADTASFIVSFTEPSGITAYDNVKMYLVKTSSRQTLKEKQQEFRTNAVLRRSGNYRIAIAPKTPQKGIWGVAIKFTK